MCVDKKNKYSLFFLKIFVTNIKIQKLVIVTKNQEMIKMTALEKEVRGIIFDLLDNEELKINDNDEIEYTQEWLNNWLMSWILDGATTKEVMKIREYFENFEYEEQVEKSYQVGVITYDNGHQEAEWEDEIVNVTIITKKIAQEEYKMKFEAVTLVNSNNEKVLKEKEAKKLKNRIKRLFNKKQPQTLIFDPNWK